MKCSLGISNFLEEISSLAHSVVFLYFFALVTEEGFLISCYSLELCIQMLSEVTQSYPILWDPMDCNMPGFPVHHQLPKLVQAYVHWVGDSIQPSHPLLSPSHPAFNLSQHQGLFQWVNYLHQVAQSTEVSASASVLPMNILDWFPLGWTGWISLQSKGLSRVFSNTTVQKYQFFGVQLSISSNSHIHTWLLEKS